MTDGPRFFLPIGIVMAVPLVSVSPLCKFSRIFFLLSIWLPTFVSLHDCSIWIQCINSLAPKMSAKPIFVATHPRACSTAFERVFMTRRNSLRCAHEPFGDAYYFGPERLAKRYEHDENSRLCSGYQDTTYKNVIDRLSSEQNEVGLLPDKRYQRQGFAHPSHAC